MTKPIIVLHVLFELRYSGAEIMLKNAASYWKEKGVIQHVLATSDKIGDYAEFLSNEGMSIHHLPFKNSIDFFSNFLHLIRTYQINVVHIHTERTALTYSILALLGRVPVIIRTLHSTYLFEGVTLINRSIRRWIMHFLGVIQVSVSSGVQENERIRFHNQTLLINNWYDNNHFYPPSDYERANSRLNLGVSNDRKVIISIGNCAPVKNHELIINAFSVLKKTVSNLEYWHIGDEDSNYTERKLVNELNLNNEVKFFGRKNDIREFLWAADVFIMPSFREGFGVAVLEAYATGIPIILAKTPGLDQWEKYFPEIIYEDNSLVDFMNKISLAFQIRKNRKDVDLTVLTNNFSIICGAKKYFELYESKNDC